MTKLAEYDTLDDRREVFHLLHRLPPRDRLRWLRWCCERVRRPDGTGPVPVHKREDVDAAYRCDRADERLTNAVWVEFWVLVSSWGLDAASAVGGLTARVRKGPASVSASATPAPPGPARTACTGG